MLRVTIELISARGRERDQTLGVAQIANDGTGDVHRGNYSYQIASLSEVDYAKHVRSGRMVDFPREYHDAWELLRRCLDQHDESGNPTEKP